MFYTECCSIFSLKVEDWQPQFLGSALYFAICPWWTSVYIFSNNLYLEYCRRFDEAQPQHFEVMRSKDVHQSAALVLQGRIILI